MTSIQRIVDCPSGYAIMDDGVPIIEGLTNDQAQAVLWNGHPPKVSSRDGVNQGRPLPTPSTPLGRYQARYKERLAVSE